MSSPEGPRERSNEGLEARSPVVAWAAVESSAGTPGWERSVTLIREAVQAEIRTALRRSAGGGEPAQRGEGAAPLDAIDDAVSLSFDSGGASSASKPTLTAPRTLGEVGSHLPASPSLRRAEGEASSLPDLAHTLSFEAASGWTDMLGREWMLVPEPREAAPADEGGEGWIDMMSTLPGKPLGANREADVERCAFTFDADHENADGTGHSCPDCVIHRSRRAPAPEEREPKWNRGEMRRALKLCLYHSEDCHCRGCNDIYAALLAALRGTEGAVPVAWMIEIQETDGTWHIMDVCVIPEARDAELRRLADRDIPARVRPLIYAVPSEPESAT